ncbi:MAG TPA: hypothetical protein VHP54_04545, partial [Caproiciproducens sp.]|nr:hypothetical protein [Caproiciproducens sp.]
LESLIIITQAYTNVKPFLWLFKKDGELLCYCATRKVFYVGQTQIPFSRFKTDSEILLHTIPGMTKNGEREF